MKKIFPAIFSIFLLLNSRNIRAQLFVDTAYSVPQMVTDFFDTTSTSISNITYTGTNIAYGFFDAAATNLGINAGILITSGSVYNTPGPNLQSSISCNNSIAGDADLENLIPGYITYDASVIEFDIVPDFDTIEFKYVFGSDEYNEYVGSAFNDVFAFFISGPGITGIQNIAQVPGSFVPVSINNVNCDTNGLYYVCNDYWNAVSCTGCPIGSAGTTVEYDGFTTLLAAYASVQPGQSYHIKIGVADAGDGIFDSGVFLSIESLGGVDSLVSESNFLKSTNGNTIEFHDESKYASNWFWDFGDGITSTERNPIHAFADLTNDIYLVKQKVWNFCCSDSTFEWVGNVSTGITTTENILTISPNPVQNILTVNCADNTPAELMLVDVTGRPIYAQPFSGSATIDLSSMAKGIYFLHVSNGRRSIFQKVLHN